MYAAIEHISSPQLQQDPKSWLLAARQRHKFLCAKPMKSSNSTPTTFAAGCFWGWRMSSVQPLQQVVAATQRLYWVGDHECRNSIVLQLLSLESRRVWHLTQRMLLGEDHRPLDRHVEQPD
jgi:hypothetical protein